MKVRPPLPAPSLRWLVVLAAVACASCSKDAGLNPVQGKILYKGNALAGAVITFHPKGAGRNINTQLPVGHSGEDGSFTLTTGDKQGAPAGEYAVTVICPEEVKLPKGQISTAPPESKDRFQGAYANRDSTTIRAEVKAGPNQLEPFQLK
jgi:hypothetical protein